MKNWNLNISLGLCVDYAVHIGHAYLVAHGNRHFYKFWVNFNKPMSGKSWPITGIERDSELIPCSRRERTHEAITSIGPAVFNGGLTTFIALVLCSMSTGHNKYYPNNKEKEVLFIYPSRYRERCLFRSYWAFTQLYWHECPVRNLSTLSRPLSGLPIQAGRI